MRCTPTTYEIRGVMHNIIRSHIMSVSNTPNIDVWILLDYMKVLSLTFDKERFPDSVAILTAGLKELDEKLTERGKRKLTAKEVHYLRELWSRFDSEVDPNLSYEQRAW